MPYAFMSYKPAGTGYSNDKPYVHVDAHRNPGMLLNRMSGLRDVLLFDEITQVLQLCVK